MDFEEFFSSRKKGIVIGAISAVVGVLLLFFFFFCGERVVQKEEVNFLQSSEISTAKESNGKLKKTTNSTSSEIYVDVKGAVKRPGMYGLLDGKRVNDVLKLAGGVLDSADVKKVNYALLLTDQMVVYVPQMGEEPPKTGVVGGGSVSGKDEKRVNLNTATIEELKSLTGVGEKKAQKIIDYREENGAFSSIDDLQKVNGFGTKTVEKLKEYLTV